MLGVDKKATVCLWERLLLALVGNQFGADTEHVCGIVLRVRYGQDLLSVWTDNADDEAAQQRIKDTMVSVMGLPTHIADTMSYRPHGRHSDKSRQDGRGGAPNSRTSFPFQGGRNSSRDGSSGAPSRGPRSNKPAFGSWRSSGNSASGRAEGGAPAARPVSDFGSWRRGPERTPDANDGADASSAAAPARRGARPAKEGRGSRHARHAQAPAAAADEAPAAAGSTAPAAPAPAPAPQSRHLLALKRTTGDATDSASGGPSPIVASEGGGARRRGVPRGAPSKLGTA